MVLDKGFVMEFDAPLALLAQQGIFYQMARDAGLAWEARHVMTASQNETPLLKEIGKSGYVGISFELMHDALVPSLTYRKGNFNCISVKRKMEMISAIWFLANNLAWTVWCSADLAGFRKKMFIWQLQVIVLRPCSWIAFSLRFLSTTKNAFGKLSVPFLLHLPLSPSPPPFIYHFPLPLPLVSSH